jgi:hypothetical protein
MLRWRGRCGLTKPLALLPAAYPFDLAGKTPLGLEILKDACRLDEDLSDHVKVSWFGVDVRFDRSGIERSFAATTAKRSYCHQSEWDPGSSQNYVAFTQRDQ